MATTQTNATAKPNEDTVTISESGKAAIHLIEREGLKPFEPKTDSDYTDRANEIIDRVLTDLGISTDTQVNVQVTKLGVHEYSIDHPQAKAIEEALRDDIMFGSVLDSGYSYSMLNRFEQERTKVFENSGEKGSVDFQQAIDTYKQIIMELQSQPF